MPLLDHFGLIAPFYDRAIPPRDPERLIRLAALPAEGALLDAGGGTGRVTATLRGMAGPLVVADESTRMLGQALDKAGLSAVCGQTEKLPFKDASFARVIMIDALHHVSHQARTLAELYRVLEPGGRIVIEEPDIRNLAGKLVAIGEKLALMRSHFLEAETVVELLGQISAGQGAGKANPPARMTIEREGFNYWVVAEKAG